MSDERGRRRDTPTGVGPGRSGGGQVPRGAGLSGNLPDGSRLGQERSLTPKGLAPVSVHSDPPARSKPVAYSAPATPPPAPRAHESHASNESNDGGPWDNAATPARHVNVEPHAVRSPPPPPRGRTVADGFAITHQADAPQPPSSRAPHPGSRPLEVSKPSLRLKLDGADPDYEGRAVRVPKRRAPLLLGILILLSMLGGGSFLWIDAHGGVDNFVAQLRQLADGSSPAPASAVVQQPPAANEPQQQPQPPLAATNPPPSAAAPQPPAAEPAVQPAQANPQVATGEVEETPPTEKANPQPPAAEPKPAAKPAARPAVPREPVVRRPPVHREPVLKIQPLGDVLNSAPPDPSGREVLPPPDPPAPD